jgi:hypothetical protein
VNKGQGWIPTQADLEGICKPCLVAFFVEFVKYADLSDLKGLAFVDLLCTASWRPNPAGGKPTIVWCILEQRRIDAMGDDTPVETKMRAICGTRCFQKMLVKIYLAAGAFNQTDQDKAKMAQVFSQLDVFCSRNAAGRLCGIEAQGFDKAFNGPGGIVEKCMADFQQLLCGATCADAIRPFYASVGCCYNTLLNAEAEWSRPGVPRNLTIFRDFANSRCKVAPPPRCFQAGRLIAARLVIRNLVWRYYLDNIALVKAAIIADIATQIGARLNQVTIDDAVTEAPKTQGAFGLMALEGVSMSIKVTSDGSADDVTTTSSQFQDSVTNNQVAFTQSTRLPYDSRADASLGLVIDPQASSVTTEIDPLGNAAGTTSVSFFAIILAMAAAFFLRA